MAAAGWAATVIGGGAAVLCVGYEVLGVALGRPSSTTGTVLGAVGLAGVIVAMVVGFRRVPERMPTWTWVGLPVLGAVAVVVLNLIAPDTGPSGHVALLYGVVFAAAHLNVAGAWLVTGVTGAAEVVIAFAGSPPADAVAHSVTMGGVLLLSTLLLVRAADHRQRLTEQLADLAALDPLTGLFTRRELERAAASALGTHAPRRREPGPRPAVGLLILDLDRFKELNDSHGHLVGDAALVHLARVVRAAAPRPAVVARLGGDELAVLVPDCAQTDPETIASEILRALGDEPVRENGLVLGLSASIGVARVLPREGRALAELYAAADAALYRAKVGGRGRVVVG